MTGIEIREFSGEGYEPQIDYQGWRVAILNYIDELLPEKIDNLHVHTETDEVFALLGGACTLILADRDKDSFVNFRKVEMKPGVLYNIRKDQYHSHTLSPEGRVIIIENSDTNDSNTFHVELKQEEQRELVKLF